MSDHIATHPDPSTTELPSPDGAVILIADKFDASGIETLSNLGHRVVCIPDLSPETLPAAIDEHNPQVLVVRSTKVRANAIDAAAQLALIVRAGAGTDIDTDVNTDIDVDTDVCTDVYIAIVTDIDIDVGICIAIDIVIEVNIYTILDTHTCLVFGVGRHLHRY